MQRRVTNETWCDNQKCGARLVDRQQRLARKVQLQRQNTSACEGVQRETRACAEPVQARCNAVRVRQRWYVRVCVCERESCVTCGVRDVRGAVH